METLAALVVSTEEEIAMETTGSIDTSCTSVDRTILGKWMFCLNALDITLNSKYSCFVPENLYGLIEETRDELQVLFHHYEFIFYTPKNGRS